MNSQQKIGKYLQNTKRADFHHKERILIIKQMTDNS